MQEVKKFRELQDQLDEYKKEALVSESLTGVKHQVKNIKKSVNLYCIWFCLSIVYGHIKVSRPT